jgi:hypothetical protein
MTATVGINIQVNEALGVTIELHMSGIYIAVVYTDMDCPVIGVTEFSIESYQLVFICLDFLLGLLHKMFTSICVLV